MVAASEFSVRRCERISEEAHTARLSNGLTLIVLPRRGFLKKHALLATRFGSLDDCFRAEGEAEARPSPAGVAHFLEHKLFEEEEGSASDRFARNGATCNAFTSYTSTAYVFTCADLFRENLDLLVDFVGRPYFTDAAIDREREIIAQEIRMYEDSPDWRVYQGLLEALYARHPVRLDITGTLESIRAIDRRELERCYRAFYTPANMALVVTGDLAPDEVRAWAEESFARRPEAYAKGAPPERRMPEEPLLPHAREARARLDVHLPRLLLGWKDAPHGETGRALLRRDLATAIGLELVFGRGSAFYERSYGRGLIDASFAASHTGERDHGYTVVGGETEDPDALRAEVVRAIEEAIGAPVRESDLARVRRKAVGKYLRGFNAIEGVATAFLSAHLLDVDLFDSLPTLESITPDAVGARLAEHLTPERMAMSVAEPIGARAPSRGGAS